VREYYITLDELHDLKFALRSDNKKMTKQILHDIEHRHHKLRMPQADMMLAYSGFYNSGG
jgi:hypothetical protein